MDEFVVTLIVKIDKARLEELDEITEILSQWTDQEEVDKYRTRIAGEINGKTEFGMKFWVISDDYKIVGVAGLADILPKIKEFAKTDNPIEIKILYLDQNQRGKGYGKMFLEFLENQARRQKKSEILIRSAIRYQDTAWGFYEKYGYKRCGTVDNDMAVFRKLTLVKN